MGYVKESKLKPLLLMSACLKKWSVMVNNDILGSSKEHFALCSTESCYSWLIKTRSDFAELCCAFY